MVEESQSRRGSGLACRCRSCCRSLSDVQLKLSATLAEALYMEVADVDSEKSFVDLGLDSIVGVEWVKVINKHYGLSLAATRVYDYPNIKDWRLSSRKSWAQLAAANAGRQASCGEEVSDRAGDKHCRQAHYVGCEICGDCQPEQSVVPAREPVVIPSAKPPACSRTRSQSSACPAGIRRRTISISIGTTWLRGKTPSSRFRLALECERLLRCRSDPARQRVCASGSAMLEDVDCFDPLFFQISPAEAQAMDPQHQTVHAGGLSSIRGRRLLEHRAEQCEVWCLPQHHEQRVLVAARRRQLHQRRGHGQSYAIGAARIAYHLNLKVTRDSDRHRVLVIARCRFIWPARRC